MFSRTIPEFVETIVASVCWYQTLTRHGELSKQQDSRLSAANKFATLGEKLTESFPILYVSCFWKQRQRVLFFLNILTNEVSPSVATLILVKCTLISCQLLDDANCFTRNLKSICRSLSWFLGLLVQPRGVRLFVCSTNLLRLRSLHSCQRENVSWNIKQTVPKRC